jgi:hypothetical protein
MQPEMSYSQSDEYAALLALLRTVSDEVYSLACDIISLGESLSLEQGAGSVSRQMRNLQSFDPLGQRAFAQARLLHGIERILVDRAVDWKARVDALIQTVPFHAERQRLSAALQGQEIVEPHQDPSCGDDLHLF